MLLTVREFTEMTRSAMPTLVSRLQDETGRFGAEEQSAWKSSLSRVAEVFERADLGNFHVQLNGRTGNVALEYRLPAASSWCDLVLLGHGEGAPAAVMVELKHWDVAGDRPGPRPGLIEHKGALDLHPSEQVRGYVEYCQRFHSAVVERKAAVSGCTFLTAAPAADAYTAAPHDQLTRHYPVFSSSSDDIAIRLPEYLRSSLRRPDPAFARQFTEGTYRQDRNFVRALAATLLDSPDALVLLEHQRRGFELCLHEARKVLAGNGSEKAVVVVEGPPGSGKSVVAARLWAALARDAELEGNFVFVTTSSSQRRNWEEVFRLHGQSLAARGVVKTANSFNPGLDGPWISKLKKKGLAPAMVDWRHNLDYWAKKSGKRPKIEDDAISVAIVDEAHALIDPTVEGGAGNRHSGWSFHAGPQIWHILRASRLTVLFLDPDQSFRDNETTTPEAIRKYAADHGARILPTISLAGAQFRCAGSREYVEWVEGLLEPKGTAPRPRSWRSQGGGPGFVFDLVDDPGALDDRLRERLAEGRTVRLLSTYDRPWKTKGQTDPHRLPDAQKDFHISYVREGKKRSWAKVWNYCPGEDYTLFIQAPEGSWMQRDVLSEVGCPYVVRGFDFDYIGLLWQRDLVWRTDHWEVLLDHVHESAWTKTVAAAKREVQAGVRGPAHDELLRRAVRGYRILLTRPIRGCYVWCEDEETRAHLESLLGEVTH